jgi:hypothetical protein
MFTAAQVKKNHLFLKEPNNLIGYQLNGNALKHKWSSISNQLAEQCGLEDRRSGCKG